MAGCEPIMPGTSSTPQTAEMESILAGIKPYAEYREQSYEASKNVHIALLEALPDPADGPEIVLLGDGIIEDMMTTGACPNFPAPWPSPALLSDEAIADYTADDSDSHLHRTSRVLNAGVSGDRIQNLIYRLVGDEDEGGTLTGLLPALARCGTVHTWIVHIGAENVTAGGSYGISEADIQALGQLTLALLKTDPTEGHRTKVILTPLFGKKHEVDCANAALKDLEKRLGNPDTGRRNILRLGIPPGYSKVKEVADDTRLNFNGYQLWVDLLWCFAGTWISHEVPARTRPSP